MSACSDTFAEPIHAVLINYCYDTGRKVVPV